MYDGNHYYNNDYDGGDGGRKKGSVFGIVAISVIVVIVLVMLVAVLMSAGGKGSVLDGILGGRENANLPPFGTPGVSARPSASPLPTPTSTGSAAQPTDTPAPTGPIVIGEGMERTTTDEDIDGTTFGDILFSEDNPVRRVAKTARASVVGIIAHYEDNGSGGEPQTVTGYSSGYIASVDGADAYIVTNYAVVNGASDLVVDIYGGEQYTAQLVGGDDLYDVAVLKISAGADGLAPVTYGDSDALRTGQISVAIGNPLGTELAGTVTAGIISYAQRDVLLDSGATLTLIQTDAAVSSGEGVLFDASGAVIGLIVETPASFTTSSGASVEGISFATPINTVLPIVEQVIATGSYARPGIGISGYNFTESDAMYYQMYYGYGGLEAGLYVSQFSGIGNAEEAGVAVGDIITSINGQRVTTYMQLKQYLEHNLTPGDTAELTMLRFNEETVTFEEHTATVNVVELK